MKKIKPKQRIYRKKNDRRALRRMFFRGADVFRVRAWSSAVAGLTGTGELRMNTTDERRLIKNATVGARIRHTRCTAPPATSDRSLVRALPRVRYQKCRRRRVVFINYCCYIFFSRVSPPPLLHNIAADQLVFPSVRFSAPNVPSVIATMNENKGGLFLAHFPYDI